jgi:hypothetical protein
MPHHLGEPEELHVVWSTYRSLFTHTKKEYVRELGEKFEKKNEFQIFEKS